MTDIVERLRGLSISGTFGPLELREHQVAEAQAADEIERLSEAVVNCHREIYSRDAEIKRLLTIIEQRN
jgi:hypothetical protein